MEKGEAGEGVEEVDEGGAMAIDPQTDKTSLHPTIRPFGLLCLLTQKVHPDSIQASLQSITNEAEYF